MDTTFGIKGSLQAELKAFIDSIKSPNILLIGESEAGKTSIVEAVFGLNLNIPIVTVGGHTKDFKEYHPANGVDLTIIDSAGYEHLKEEKFIKDTYAFLDARAVQGPEKQIHLAWYVIKAGGRLKPFDIDLIRRLDGDRVPIIVVLSQCDAAGDPQIHELMRHLNTPALSKTFDSVVCVAARPMTKNGAPSCSPYGLNELVEESVRLLPELYVDAFLFRVAEGIKAKRKRAYRWVTGTAATCFAAGFIPLPFSTAATTYVAQRQLFARLTALFGFGQFEVAELVRSATFSVQGLVMIGLTSFFDLFIFEMFTNVGAGAMAATYVMRAGLAMADTLEEMASREMAGFDRAQLQRDMKGIFDNKFKQWSAAKLDIDWEAVARDKLKENVIRINNASTLRVNDDKSVDVNIGEVEVDSASVPGLSELESAYLNRRHS